MCAALQALEGHEGSSSENDEGAAELQAQGPTYVQEQQQLRQAFLQVLSCLTLLDWSLLQCVLPVKQTPEPSLSRLHRRLCHALLRFLSSNRADTTTVGYAISCR